MMLLVSPALRLLPQSMALPRLFLAQTPAEFCRFSGAFPLALGAICAAKAVPSSRSESANAVRQNSKAPGVSPYHAVSAICQSVGSRGCHDAVSAMLKGGEGTGARGAT